MLRTRSSVDMLPSVSLKHINSYLLIQYRCNPTSLGLLGLGVSLLDIKRPLLRMVKLPTPKHEKFKLAPDANHDEGSASIQFTPPNVLN